MGLTSLTAHYTENRPLLYGIGSKDSTKASLPQEISRGDSFEATAFTDNTSLMSISSLTVNASGVYRSSSSSQLKESSVNAESTRVMASIASSTATQSHAMGHVIALAQADPPRNTSIISKLWGKLTGSEDRKITDEDKAYTTLLNASKSRNTAKRELKWLKKNLPEWAHLDEMAEFYILARESYPDSGKYARYKDDLIYRSLLGINQFLHDGYGQFNDISREERKQCIKILFRAMPPDHCAAMHPDHNIGSCDTEPTTILREIIKIARDSTSESSYNHINWTDIPVSFTPPAPGADKNVVEMTELFAEWITNVMKSKVRYKGEMSRADTMPALDALRIVRKGFHFDPEKTAELAELTEYVKDPAQAFGIMELLKEFPPCFRDAARKEFEMNSVEIFIRSYQDHAPYELARKAGWQTYRIYSTLHPGETHQEVQEKLRPLVPYHDADKEVPYFFKSSNIIHERMYMVRKYREADENIERSLERYTTFTKSMRSHDVDSFEVDKIYSLMGNKLNELFEAINGAHTYQDVIEEIDRIAVGEWLSHGLPARLCSDFISLGLEKRGKDETLSQSCSRIAREYRYLGDFTKIEELRKMVEEGVKKGEIKEDEKDRVSDEIMQSFKMKCVAGEESDDSIDDAYRDVTDKSEKIITTDDAIYINGVRLDIRAEQGTTSSNESNSEHK